VEIRAADPAAPHAQHEVARTRLRIRELLDHELATTRASGSVLEASDEQGTILAVMSGARRKGVWEPPERLRVLSLMGGVELDFREAEFLDGVTEVVVLAVMGGVAIVAPPGVDVEADGVGLITAPPTPIRPSCASGGSRSWAG
jgi:hypothetical protein